MSDLIANCQLSDSNDCPVLSEKAIIKKIPTRNAHIGKNMTIRRALPNHERRMIGAWCFFDHFGPLNLKEAELDIAPHPHMGLQTFTWTIAGEILHRDSLGSEQIIQPGAVNLMTAGKGIAHSEESLPDSTLHGVQLWIALPNSVRNNAPDFNHYPKMPTYQQDGLLMTLLVGDLFHLHAPTKVYSPLIALDLNALETTSTMLPLNPEFEYGVLSLKGQLTVEGETIGEDTLLYLGTKRDTLTLNISKDTRAFLIGGEPFKEEILLWWNFVARTCDEIAEATKDWANHLRFGEVSEYVGGRLNAPEFRLKD